MKIFISGPMTDIQDYNFPKFNNIEKCLVNAGFDVLNPVHICKKYKEDDIIKHSHVFEDMIGEQLKELRKCTHILLLDGWHCSIGAKRELKYALIENIGVLLESDLETLINFHGSKKGN